MKSLSFLESEVQMPAMKLPVRSVIVQLDSGPRILISPGSQLSSAQLQSVAPISDLVAPNLFHTAGIKAASLIHTKARIWGPSSQFPQRLDEAHWPYQDELSCYTLNGMPKVREVVFFHPASRSLIVTDLCFNLLDPKGWGAWLILNLFGTYRKFGVSRLFLMGVKDKDAFCESLKQILKLDFDHIVLSHGNLVLGDAKGRLKQALELRGYRLD